MFGVEDRHVAAHGTRVAYRITLCTRSEYKTSAPRIGT
jgi:hypothetical protein